MVFDRKTFNPLNNKEAKNRLAILRSRGRRRWWLAGWKVWTGSESNKRTISRCLEGVFTAVNPKGTLLIDAGCGDSGDADAWCEQGGRAVGYDLFPREEEVSFPETQRLSAYTHKRLSDFKIQDICETWPVLDSSVDVIICSAVMSLVPPLERPLFYRQVARVLKSDGHFFLSYTYLQGQHWWWPDEEMASMKEAGIKNIHVL